MADLEAIQDVYRRLTRAPLLRKVKQAQAQVAAAVEAVQAADAAVAAAGQVVGESIGEAFRQREMLYAQQAEHRKGAPARDLFASTFDEVGHAHLVRSFTLDRHVALQLDQGPAWENWAPPEQPVGLVASGKNGFLLRWGGHAGQVGSAMLSAAPLIGGGKPWVILSDDASEERARDLLRALVLRLACTLPQQSRFTLLDPLHYGQTFPMQRYLPAVRESSGDLARDLQPIQADVRRIIRDVVAFHDSFEALPAEQQAAERYEFVVAADFPRAKAYDRRVAEMLFDIGRAGPKAGRYLILHVTQDAEWPHGIDFEQLGEYGQIDLRGDGCTYADAPPSPRVQQLILERVRSATPVRRSAGFTEILPPREQWWSGTAARRIETTLDGRKDGLEVVFGQRDDGTELVHGVLAAAAGAGKSNLLHTLLLGFATRYAPDELQLYLMDLKQGVEFQPYARLPHAAVVAYNADASLARAVISELRLEMRRRYEDLFRRSGVQKLEDYRNIGQPHGPAPRILLVVDEYQALFQGADAQDVSADLLALSTQGRAAGVHMLLGSQTFRAVGMQGSEQIFNNINVRMAMRMPAAVAQAMTEFGPGGKEMIRSCDAPGKVVLNTAAGHDNGNRLGQVVLVSADDRARVLDELAAMAATWPAERRATWPTTQVFDGSQAPPLGAHSLTRAAGRDSAALDAARLARWAASAKSGGGLARGDWRASDGPVPLLIGREYAVHGDAAVVLRRLPNQNLLVLGGSVPARLGMLGGIAASAAAVAADVLARVRVIDFSNDPSVAAVFAGAGDRIEIVDPAQALAALDAPPGGGVDLLVLIEPDRCIDLLRPADPLARAAGVDALERRLREGPLGGRHTAFVCSGHSALNRVLGRRGAALFAWRAVTQISQEDSQDLLGNRLGAQLRNEGGGPEAALLADVDGNRYTRFMPYGT